MSEIIDPPEYYFTGINFNPAFYNQDAGTGLSEATANGLYLRKTVPDTATALETFSSGLVTSLIRGPTTASILTIGSNITTGSVNIGNTGVRTKVTGTLETTTIRTPATNDTLTICTDQTAVGQISIGSSASEVFLNGTVQTPNTLQANTINGTTATSVMTIAGNLTTAGSLSLMSNSVAQGILNLMYSVGSFATGTINIGQYNATPSPTKTTTNIRGDVNVGTSATTNTILGTTNINATGGLSTTIGTSGSGTNTIRAGTNTITGLTGINNLGSGNTTIGTSGGTSSNTFYGSNTLVGTTQINATGSGTTTIGTNGGTSVNTIYGSTTVGSGTEVLTVNGSGIKFDVLSTNDPTGVQNLYSNKTAGTLSISVQQTSGSINVGGVGSTTTIKGTGVVDGTFRINNQTSVGGAPINGYTGLSVICNSGYAQEGITIKSNSDSNAQLSSYNNAGGFRGGIIGVNATSISFATSSDRRLKLNIKPMNTMIDKIMSLKPSEYNWAREPEKIGFGFIAQEVHKIFPQFRLEQHNCDDIENPCHCETGEEKFYGLDYGQFTPYIVKAVQELKQDYDTKLSKLEARLLALEGLIPAPLHVEATELHETIIV